MIRIDEQPWLYEASEKLKEKLYVVAQRNQGIIPRTVGTDGRYDNMAEKNIRSWTNGFWGGMMWQMYHATKEEVYFQNAVKVEELLDTNLMDYRALDHDTGFKWLFTAVAHYKEEPNEASYNRAMLAAGNLAGRFNLAGNFIRAWNDDNGSRAGWAIIDCMMNLPLLYWAYEQTEDNRFYHIAKRHADTAMKYFIREDASVKHIVEFDPASGLYLKSHAGQGYAHGSSWTRGQAWAIYGFAISYRYTEDEAYLECAKSVADYFMTNIKDDGLVPIDFRQPKNCRLEDTSATAVAVCGLLEIASLNPENGKKYEAAALFLLKTLVEKRSNFDLAYDNILEKCSPAFHEEKHEYPIIFGDYFFLEAILKATGEELCLW